MIELVTNKPGKQLHFPNFITLVSEDILKNSSQGNALPD